MKAAARVERFVMKRGMKWIFWECPAWRTSLCLPSLDLFFLYGSYCPVLMFISRRWISRISISWGWVSVANGLMDQGPVFIYCVSVLHCPSFEVFPFFFFFFLLEVIWVFAADSLEIGGRLFTSGQKIKCMVVKLHLLATCSKVQKQKKNRFWGTASALYWFFLDIMFVHLLNSEVHFSTSLHLSVGKAACLWTSLNPWRSQIRFNCMLKIQHMVCWLRTGS